MNPSWRLQRDSSHLDFRELTALLDMANDAVIVIDGNGRVGFWNRGAERLYGWQRAEVLGRSAHTLLRAVFPIPLLRIKERVAQEGEWRGDLIHTKQDGTTVTVSSRWSPRYSTKGKLIGTFEVNRDVTDERKAQVMQLKLRNLDRLAGIGLLASSLAHEINSPLDAINGLIYLLQREKQSRQAYKHLATIRQELDRVTAVIRNTLSLARRASSEAGWAELAELLDSTLRVYPRRFKSRTIEVQRRYRTKGPCYCISTEVRQVMVNLVGNALDAMPHDGVLRLYLRNKVLNGRPGFRIAISDTGHGITRSAQQHLFEPLHTTKGELGTGLGLWISKNIVEHCGGTLRFRTRTQGLYRGTCFFLQIPAHTAGGAITGHALLPLCDESDPTKSPVRRR